MHIITKLYFRINLNFIFESKFTIYMHTKNLHQTYPFILYNKILHII
jgi:hypothetical protein